MVFLTVVSVDYNGGLIAAQLYFTIHISVFYFMNTTGLFWTTWGLLFLFRKLGTVSDGTETTGEMAEINAAADCEFVFCVYSTPLFLSCSALGVHCST